MLWEELKTGLLLSSSVVGNLMQNHPLLAPPTTSCTAQLAGHPSVQSNPARLRETWDDVLAAVVYFYQRIHAKKCSKSIKNILYSSCIREPHVRPTNKFLFKFLREPYMSPSSSRWKKYVLDNFWAFFTVFDHVKGLLINEVWTIPNPLCHTSMP